VISRSSISSRFARSALVAVVVLWTTAIDLSAREGSKDWIVLSNCRFIANPANDGDSFHASADANEYIFRLYLVDAPETDEMTPARLVEQAKYFGISVPQAIEVGREAKEFTGGEAFRAVHCVHASVRCHGPQQDREILRVC
jgi:hypothetical protein